MLSPYQFFRIYSAVNMHFTSNYDIFKYAGKAKTINKEVFDNRRDRERFSFWSSKIDNPDDALRFCVFNFIHDNIWFYNSFEEAKDRFLTGNKYYSSFTRNIRKDYDFINQLKLHKQVSLKEITEPTRSGNKPVILQLVVRRDVSIEFVCYLNHSHNFIDTWKPLLDPLVEEESIKICKYTKFMLKFSNG